MDSITANCGLLHLNSVLGNAGKRFELPYMNVILLLFIVARLSDHSEGLPPLGIVGS